jgi:hypothetical protein
MMNRKPYAKAPLCGLVLVCTSLAACGGGAKSPSGGGTFASPLADAVREEAQGDPSKAIEKYLSVVDRAAESSSDPWQVAALEASLDALVGRSVSAFEGLGIDASLAYRTTSGEAITRRLEAAYAKAEDPFAPGIIAHALEDLARSRGDAGAAEKWRRAGGCAREATVIGPVSWATVTGLRDPDPLDRFDARVVPIQGPGPFGGQRMPMVVAGRGCGLEIGATSSTPGVRDVIVDVHLAGARQIGVAMRSRAPAVLRAGGRLVLDRGYELGGGSVAQFVRLDAKGDTLRLVARVGMSEDSTTLELDAWDEHGKPLAVTAPKQGEAVDGEVTASTPVTFPEARTPEERLLVSLGALAARNVPEAERVLKTVATRPDAPPELALAYARAVESVRDLPSVQGSERARGAYDRVLDVWPGAWEPMVAHAVLAGVRRGRGEAGIETLRDLDERREKAGAQLTASSAAVVNAFEAAVSGRERLFDRAHAAFERARGPLAGTALLEGTSQMAFDRVGPERIAATCGADRRVLRDRFDCYDALRATGDHPAAARELERVRALFGAPQRFSALALRDAINAGDLAGARRIFDAMLPGEKTLSAFYTVSGSGDAAATRKALFALAPDARDVPSGIAPLLRALGDDPLHPFEGVADKLAEQDRRSPLLPNAATAVLAHKEQYEIDATGLLHFVLFDVRRVSGTTDVEQNAAAGAPDILGRATARALRRRILKRDGRVLEPDKTPFASQAHADLSQLEQGDIVEAIYEGWGLPDDAGNLGIDSPDLLPERTAVHEATLEVKLPSGLRPALWSHPMLGKPTETSAQGSRVLRWSMKDRLARRLEDGVPRMDRSVGVSLTTMTWGEVARGLRETLASLDEHDPEIAAWAREAAKGKAPGSRALVEAVVAAAGKDVREAQPGVLSDFGIGRSVGPQALTARTALTEHEGSRTWLVMRALRELGVRAEVLVAEDEPFSADPAFPPHFGRFTHPLLVAHVTGGDVWVDADVAGPPLPAGRVSPELRGRSALRGDGPIMQVPNAGGTGERDEVDIRLALDAKGDAKGTFTVTLQGRDAQEIAEGLFRVVGAERQKALQGIVLAWVPFANVDDVALSSTEGSWQVAVRAQISVSGYAQAEGGGSGAGTTWVLPGMDALHFVLPPRPHVSSLGATYAGQGGRENALAISSAVLYHVHRRVELPPGATVKRAPRAYDVVTPELTAKRMQAVNGAVVEDDFTLDVPTGTIAATKYDGFVRNAHRTDDAFLSGTWIKPGG